MKYQKPLGAADPNESYVDGNTSTGIEGSVVPAASIEHTMREIVAVITAAGLTPSDSNLTQLDEAIRLLIGSNQTEIGNASLTTAGITKLSNSLASDSQTIAATSFAAKKLNDAIQNLNSLFLVGAPVPWPSEIVPSGYLQMRGQSFDPAAFPQLAVVYPSHVLKDMRGEFIRGGDDGRGVDAGRNLLTSQTDQNKAHTHGYTAASFTYHNPGSGHIFAGSSANRTTSSSGGGESRPRNVAFMYITRAA
jgi:hypothetical protein